MSAATTRPQPVVTRFTDRWWVLDQPIAPALPSAHGRGGEGDKSQRWPTRQGSTSRMRMNWQDLGAAAADAADGATVEIEGFAATIAPMDSAHRFVLAAEPGCCVGCFPGDRSATVEVFATTPVASRGRCLR